MHDGQLPQCRAPHRPASMRKLNQTIASRKKRLGKMHRRAWIELKKIRVRPPNPTHSRSRPDDRHRLRRRRRNFLALGKLPKPRPHPVMRNNPASRNIRLRLRVQACLLRRVRRDIENRFNPSASHQHLSPKLDFSTIQARIHKTPTRKAGAFPSPLCATRAKPDMPTAGFTRPTPRHRPHQGHHYYESKPHHIANI